MNTKASYRKPIARPQVQSTSDMSC